MSASFADVRVGIVGPGAIGRFHASALRQAGAEIAAVAGPHAGANEEFAQAYHVPRSYPSIDSLLASGGVDAVVIASPSSFHATQTLSAIAAGIPALCEIPAGRSLAEVERVLAAAADARATVMVAHTLRYVASFSHVVEMVANGEIAFTQVAARGLFRRHDNVGWTGRRRTWTDSLLWHHGGHIMDMTLCLLGDPAPTVAGWSGRRWSGNGEPMDVVASLVTRDGRLGSLSLSYHSEVSITDDYILISENATYQVRGLALWRGTDLIVPAEIADESTQPGQMAQAVDFLTWVVTGATPQATLEAVWPSAVALSRIAPPAEATP